MQTDAKSIRAIHVATSGDASVGIGGTTLTVLCEIDTGGMDADERAEFLRGVRERAEALLAWIADERARALFDYELERTEA